MDSSGDLVAGVVVLFYPAPEVVENIETYLSSLVTLFVVDNTPEPDPMMAQRLSELVGVEYLPLRANEGVARALNLGAELAAERGYELLLTMDQDSRALPRMVQTLRLCMEAQPHVAMVSAALLDCGEVGVGCYQSDFLITSGSILRLDAWRDVGPFMEDLFIDLVDIEYCLRLRRHGYGLLKSREAILIHSIGAPSTHRWFLVGRIGVSNHPALRRYYLWRNALHLRDVYGGDLPGWCLATGRALGMLLILLYETDRTDKLRMILKGYRDHHRGLLGRYPDGLTDARHVLDELRATGRVRAGAASNELAESATCGRSGTDEAT